MLDAPELAALLLHDGPQDAGVVGDESAPVPAPAIGHAADDLSREWSARLALAQTQPRQREGHEISLVLSLRDVFVLAERVVATVRHRTLLHTAHLEAFVLSSTTTPMGGTVAAELLPDVDLDPVAVSAGEWSDDLGAVIETAHLVFEAALATAYEAGRETRPMITGLVCDQGIVNLVARPAQRSLTFCHRDAAGTAHLLAGLLTGG